MPPGISSRSSSGSRGPTTAETRVSIRDLEAALQHALAERDSEFAAVEDELVQLSRIYERLRGDMQAIKEERDRALDAVREERERRARETLELNERLHEAMAKEDANRPVDGASLRERFVAERLKTAPTDRKKLPEDAMPELDGFEFVGKIGKGGMATVYQAKRLSDGLDVAVKLLHDGAEASRARTELFLREAAVMLQLEHPGLVAAFDAGECSYGRYLVMELVQGDSLAARVRRDGPLRESEAVRVAIQMARALAYCARLGLTHRDVKPSNALVMLDGTVKLCDFGLAALTAAGDPARPYGSPGYASPEQLATPGDVDERADIYGLGCAVWHLVVGRRPFSGPARQAFDEARETDLADPRFEGADISPRLAQVIRRMGRADRGKRYRRWDECLLDLMLVEKGNPPFSAHLADAREPMAAEVASASASAEPPSTGAFVEEPQAATQRAPDPAPAKAAAPVDPSPATPTIVWQAPATTPTQRAVKNAAIAASIATAGVVGFLLGLMGQPDTVAEMRAKARLIENEGRGPEAARLLREAAKLATPDAAQKLRWEADAIEKK